MRLVQEEIGQQRTTHIYEDQDSYAPLAGVSHTDTQQSINDKDIHYIHADLNGVPEELTSSQGDIVWQARYSTWGNTVKEEWVQTLAESAGWISEEDEHLLQTDPQALKHKQRLKQQNLRYQGQYFDQETGLHYNTFRTYDPDCGRFISQDPIGLEGGINLYQYAPNAFLWIDPWGWASYDPGNYDVHFEARLPQNMYRGTGPEHFSEGNRQLHYAMKNDAKLAASLKQKYPGISKALIRKLYANY